MHIGVIVAESLWTGRTFRTLQTAGKVVGLKMSTQQIRCLDTFLSYIKGCYYKLMGCSNRCLLQEYWAPEAKDRDDGADCQDPAIHLLDEEQVELDKGD